ncbi:MAG: DUF2155 domain-containing protein [Salinarimonadaceae bacterium]|nr:MAG: DUF2155 domain-containing protein [Salinarimonadaceae bacterium]
MTVGVAFGICFGCAQGAGAQDALPVEVIENPIAVFSGLDKITARIISFEALIDETVQFGSLLLTPRACHTRPPTESPNTTAFIEVEDVSLDGSVAPLFAGWIFAASPGLNAIEHPIYDLWLLDCHQTSMAEAESEMDGERYVPPESLGRPTGEIPIPPRRPRF